MAKDDYARLSPQARMVLYLLGLTKGGCTEKVLGELMGMSDIAMERHVGELLRQGWVRLEGDRLAVCGDADSLSLSLSLCPSHVASIIAKIISKSNELSLENFSEKYILDNEWIIIFQFE